MAELDEGTATVPDATTPTEEILQREYPELTEDGEVTEFSAELKRLLEGQVGRISEDLEARCAQHVAEVKRGFLEDAVLLRDRVAAYRRDVTGMFEGLERECEELLCRAGLVEIESPRLDFNPTIQRAVGTEPTPSADLVGKVARKVRCGIVHEDGRVFRPEEVIVYRKEPEHEQQ